MVTGIEAAGIALAILPLVVNQADNYVQGLETLKMFGSRRYRREMKSHYNSLSTQRSILESVLERCFEGVVEYEEELAELINNPTGPLWRDPTLQKMLNKKLGRDFDNFILTVTELAELLEGFSKKLGLSTEDSTPENLWKNSSVTEREIKKIKDILSKSIYSDYISKMKSANETLEKIVEQSQYRENVWRKQRLPKRHLLRFKTARKVAHSLYGIVCRGELWDCQCQDQHHVQIQLNVVSSVACSGSTELPKFRMLLTSKAPFEPASTWHWQEVETETSITGSPTPEAKSSIQESKGSVIREPRVSFAIVTSILKSIPWPKVEGPPFGSPVVNICNALTRTRAESMCEARKLMGFVSDPNHRHTLYAVGDLTADLQLHSLGDLLTSTSNALKSQDQSKKVLRRRDRLRLAASLASSVLQFHGNWLKTHWGTEDILLRTGAPQNKVADSIYLAQQTPNLPNRPGTSMTQENSPSTHLIRNKILFPLGLALVELSLGQTIASLRKPEDDDPEEAVSKLKTASRHLLDVRNESGMRYEEVVDRCLLWPDRKDISLDNEGFQRTMFDSIILPLLEDLKYFEGENQIQ